MTRRSTPIRPRWRPYLPDFESASTANRVRRHAANALSLLGWGEAGAVRNCRSNARCRSGLCPSCVRLLRIRLLEFLHRERLHRLRWLFVTVRVEGWTIPAGDRRPFGQLRDHALIEAFIARLRRLGRPGLLLFGSVETVYRTVANVPVGKPFHLHLMVAGVGTDELRALISAAFPLAESDVVPLDIVGVSRSQRDFFRAASYAFKQPFTKRSVRVAEVKGVAQLPTAAEMRELLSNLGVHGWTGRLILVGVRCDSGRFRLTAEMSATPQRANSAHRRKMTSQALGRPP